MRHIGLVFLLSLSLAAPPSGGVSISPTRVELALAPGETAEVVVVLRGQGEFSLGVGRFTMRGDLVVLTGEPCPELTPEASTVRLDGALSLRVRAEAPQTPGTTACLFTLTPRAEGVAVAAGVPVYLTLKGTERPALGIAVLRDGRVVLENTGNVLLRLRGFVSYVEDQEVARLLLEDFPLIPGNTRVLPPPEGVRKGQVVVYLEAAGKRWAKQGEYSR